MSVVCSAVTKMRISLVFLLVCAALLCLSQKTDAKKNAQSVENVQNEGKVKYKGKTKYDGKVQGGKNEKNKYSKESAEQFQKETTKKYQKPDPNIKPNKKQYVKQESANKKQYKQKNNNEVPVKKSKKVVEEIVKDTAVPNKKGKAKRNLDLVEEEENVVSVEVASDGKQQMKEEVNRKLIKRSIDDPQLLEEEDLRCQLECSKCRRRYASKNGTTGKKEALAEEAEAQSWIEESIYEESDNTEESDLASESDEMYCDPLAEECDTKPIN